MGEPKGQRRVGTVRRFPVIILEHLEPASRSPARGAAAAFRTRHTSTTLTLKGGRGGPANEKKVRLAFAS